MEKPTRLQLQAIQLVTHARYACVYSPSHYRLMHGMSHKCNGICRTPQGPLSTCSLSCSARSHWSVHRYMWSFEALSSQSKVFAQRTAITVHFYYCPCFRLLPPQWEPNPSHRTRQFRSLECPSALADSTQRLPRPLPHSRRTCRCTFLHCGFQPKLGHRAFGCCNGPSAR